MILNRILSQIKKLIASMTIHKKLLFSFTTLLFCVLLVHFIILSVAIDNSFKTINKDFVISELNRKNTKIDSFFDRIDISTRKIISNLNLQALMARNESGDIDINYRSIMASVSNSLDENVAGFYLVSNSGIEYIEGDFNYSRYIRENSSSFYQKLRSSGGELVCLNNVTIDENEDDSLIIFGRIIKDLHHFKEIGYIILVIPSEALYKELEDEFENGAFYLANNEGTVVLPKYSYNRAAAQATVDSLMKLQTDLASRSIIRSNSITTVRTNEKTGLHLIYSVSVEFLNKTFLKLTLILFIVGITAIAINIIITSVISKYISYPLKILIVKMKQLQKVDFTTDMGLDDNRIQEINEIVQLEGGFEEMSVKLNNLIRIVYLERIKEREAELIALRAQINPHFMFNTLDTIYWMLISKGEEEIAELITTMSQILRYNIKNDNKKITLNDEILQLERFFLIQKARYEDKLRYQINVEPGTKDCNVVPFLIQPFVENAINHGIMKMKSFGEVIVNTKIESDLLVIQILDDGIGMGDDYNRFLFQEMSFAERSSNIGISNVNSRIQLLYGEKYGVKIESEINVGTKITILLPIIKTED